MKKVFVSFLMIASVFNCKADTKVQVYSNNFTASDTQIKQNFLIIPEFKNTSNANCKNSEFEIEIRNKNATADPAYWSTCTKTDQLSKIKEKTMEAYFSNRISLLPTLNDPDLESYFCSNNAVAIVNFFSNKSPSITPINGPNTNTFNCHNFFSKRYGLHNMNLEISNITSVAPLKFAPKLRELTLHGDSPFAEVEGLHHLTSLETLNLSGLRFNLAELLNMKNLKSLHIDHIDINLALTTWIAHHSKKGLNLYSGNLVELSIKNSLLLEEALPSIASIHSLRHLVLINNQLKNIAPLAELQGLVILKVLQNPSINLIDLIKIIDSTELWSLHFDNSTRILISHSLP